ncbi:hypothetical protein FB446DRAFT_218821 [Lentinula raphanica]|uniref:BTB domain-containing protein n=1 Tax=Lentinula raphanica TaxID=153919 RepID=A0AA38UC48_9AGAR|nr:hypothetical protein FB446DRAFT_218821 [Lentinula raphanica]KAJ3824094.1 hypothetical protein F5880DRAFT_433464 [Lentinula raphanica]KAJ3836849.1 hypothetical protein F5878DRAFT_624138 [Lentinula raphanica]
MDTKRFGFHSIIRLSTDDCDSLTYCAQDPLTPPPSDYSNHDSEVSVSPTFRLEADWHDHIPNITLISTDSVAFYVHSQTLLDASDNGFRSLIPTPISDTPQVLYVPEFSETLNLILHVVYRMPFSRRYTFEDLSTVVHLLPVYGVHPKSYILPDTHMYMSLLSYSPILPLQVYTLAAKHGLEELAVPTSSHLLALDLSTLSDETAEAIGSEYLRRLFFLHIGRVDALKRLLLQPPNLHPPTDDCDAIGQSAMTRVWALASAYLAWDSRPDLSANLLESTFTPLKKEITCDLCKKNLETRIEHLSSQWSQVKCTI